MIQKIIIFNEKQEIRLKRIYCKVMNNEEIIKKVLKEKDCNIVDNIIFKKYSNLYVCFVVANENELYILGLIDLFMELLAKTFSPLTELNFIYQFSTVYNVLDKIIVGGYVVDTKF